MDKLLYGVAYYDEYMPYDRLDQDIEMMKAANINVVRIGESTWSTMEPQPGVFDTSHLTRVIEAMGKAGILVIIGTPTYAIPTWMVAAYPEIIETTKDGKEIYGRRQNMDITHPAYRFFAERIIRRMMETCAHYDNVIGVQLDNETKAYGTASANVQQGFVRYLKEKFGGSLDALNAAFGLDYWSNRINAWEDFPDVRGTINGSLGAEFQRYQREVAAEFLMWQRSIVEPYLRPDQFITHNTDLSWRGYSYGINSEVDVYEDAKATTLLGVDIYHPSQSKLTGLEIAFGGDLTRSVKQANYLILETEAQGFPEWLPYDGQLRLQAFSHLASGADMVEYWHWHSLHNAIETYWKGLLSHDFKENDTYRAAKQIGSEFAALSPKIMHLKKENRVAVLVSNTALTA
ncbi:MAG: beta-galactosidase, partial [Clostridia bacterium]|nr:beta-galactosidase [Clostridia bacterium]